MHLITTSLAADNVVIGLSMGFSMIRSLAATILCLVHPVASSYPSFSPTTATSNLFPSENTVNNGDIQQLPRRDINLNPIPITISSNTDENVPALMIPSSQQQQQPPDVVTSSPDIEIIPSNKPKSHFVWKKRKGRLTLNLQGKPFHLYPHGTMEVSPSFDDNGNLIVVEETLPTSTEQPPVMTISTDVAGVVRLALIGARVSFSFLSAFVGTLRLLAPLIVARRGINAMSDTYVDYMTGRYLRTTYNKIEHHYVRTYQIPAALRAMGRILVQGVMLQILGHVMEGTVGLSHPPCAHNGGCYWWCGLMWIAAVAGTGHAASTAVAAWGGPLKLQREEAPLPMVRPTRVFTRPWHVLQWMRDPDEWINMMSRPKSFSNYRHNRRLTEPFLPNRHLFPATWSSIRIIQSLAIARAMFAAAKATTSADDNRVLRQVVMRQFLVQQCLSDEWHRVLLVERRVALAGCIHLFYFAATIFLVIILATMDGLATFLMLPSTLAVVVSGWINLYIFWNRMEDRRRDNNWAPTVIDTWADRKQATVKAIQL